MLERIFHFCIYYQWYLWNFESEINYSRSLNYVFSIFIEFQVCIKGSTLNDYDKFVVHNIFIFFLFSII